MEFITSILCLIYACTGANKFILKKSLPKVDEGNVSTSTQYVYSNLRRFHFTTGISDSLSIPNVKLTIDKVIKEICVNPHEAASDSRGLFLRRRKNLFLDVV